MSNVNDDSSRHLLVNPADGTANGTFEQSNENNVKHRVNNVDLENGGEVAGSDARSAGAHDDGAHADDGAQNENSNAQANFSIQNEDDRAGNQRQVIIAANEDELVGDQEGIEKD